MVRARNRTLELASAPGEFLGPPSATVRDPRRQRTTKSGEPMMTLLRLTALALTAIALVPSGAHLCELPGKIGLPRAAYLTVQGIYAGWSWFAAPIFAAIAANGALFAAERRRDPAAARAALDRKSLVEGKSVDLGGRRVIQK